MIQDEMQRVREGILCIFMHKTNKESWEVLLGFLKKVQDAFSLI